MAASPFPRWNDDRLDELNREVGRMRPVITEVAVLKSELKNLSRALDANTKAIGHVSDQFEQVQAEPVQRGRNFRSALFIALAAALTGGGFAVLGAVVVRLVG